MKADAKRQTASSHPKTTLFSANLPSFYGIDSLLQDGEGMSSGLEERTVHHWHFFNAPRMLSRPEFCFVFASLVKRIADSRRGSGPTLVLYE